MLFGSDQSLLWIVTILALVWLGGVTYLLLRTIANYNRLTEGASEKTLSEILNSIVKEEDIAHKKLTEVSAAISAVKRDTSYHIQKMGLVRFNPFSDTGGDQSFSLALLNGQDDGFIITSLYARTGVRWYVKTISKNKGVEHELSKEEKEALKKAASSK